MFELIIKFENDFSWLWSQVKSIIEFFHVYYSIWKIHISFVEINGPTQDGFGLQDIEKILQDAEPNKFFCFLPDDIQFEWWLFTCYDQSGQPVGFFESFDTSDFVVYSEDKNFLHFLQNNSGISGSQWLRRNKEKFNVMNTMKWLLNKEEENLQKSNETRENLLKDSHAHLVENTSRW